VTLVFLSITRLRPAICCRGLCGLNGNCMPDPEFCFDLVAVSKQRPNVNSAMPS
jgi:hypothetical protein